MALTDPYASVQEYRDVVDKTDAASDGAILDDLTAVSRWLDLKLGRFFTKDAAPVARVFTIPGALRNRFMVPPLGWAESENPYMYGTWSRSLTVDDIASTTGLSIICDTDRNGLFDDGALAATDYELWPLNAALGPEPKPYTTIVIPSWSTVGGFPVGVRVQVTAVWGWPAIPAAIARATCHLTGILRLESPRATSRVNELGEVLSTSKQARDLLEDLRAQYARKDAIV